MNINPFTQFSGAGGGNYRARLASQQPVENTEWKPQKDGVFVQSSGEQQWKPNLSETQMGELRGQLSQAQNDRISVSDLATLANATWVIRARHDSDSRERLTLLHVQPGDAKVTPYGVSLPSSDEKGAFLTPDGFHFSGASFNRAPEPDSQTSIGLGDQLFRISDQSAAVMLETARNRDSSQSFSGEKLKPENMTWSQRLKSRFQIKGSGFFPSISSNLKNPFPIRTANPFLGVGG